MGRKVHISRIDARYVRASHVIGHSHDLELRQVAPEVHVQRKLLADGILVWPQPPRRGLADNRDRLVSVRFRRRERAAALDWDTHCAEVAAGYEVRQRPERSFLCWVDR